MAQLICGGCRTLLMHPRGATSVRCACCHTVNLVPGSKSQVNGGTSFRELRLTYLIERVLTNLLMSTVETVEGENSALASRFLGATQKDQPEMEESQFLCTPLIAVLHPLQDLLLQQRATARSQNQTVVIQNPMSLDESDKLGASPLSDRSASSRKSEEVITDDEIQVHLMYCLLSAAH
ncbi:hypothetical protein RND71_034442 [Anisodus tanguticus]|uniref:Zinc finger LSD1-type domain-containing protein n=1 Tax=Anisodus tanguticus TaxID=243964 RepID=A0AAE1RAR5_9SOLA|nr:hypothetical protein RND71_034442 [Anisodus tanguticus]